MAKAPDSIENWVKKHAEEVAWLLHDKYGLTGTWNFRHLSENQRVDIVKLEQGWPLAYVIGWVNFCGLKIDLRFRPLIPRPETEYWLEKLMDEWEGKPPARVLDICCGSGCIGLALAKRWPVAQVVSVDIDDRAISQTRLNAQELGIKNVKIIQSNLFAELNGERPFDLIVSNPPYLDPEVEHPAELAEEPAVALYAAEGGLEIVRRLLEEGRGHLNIDGQIWIECGQEQEKATLQLAKKLGWEAETEQDQFKQFRVLKARQISHINEQ